MILVIMNSTKHLLRKMGMNYIIFFSFKNNDKLIVLIRYLFTKSFHRHIHSI